MVWWRLLLLLSNHRAEEEKKQKINKMGLLRKRIESSHPQKRKRKKEDIVEIAGNIMALLYCCLMFLESYICVGKGLMAGLGLMVMAVRQSLRTANMQPDHHH